MITRIPSLALFLIAPAIFAVESPPQVLNLSKAKSKIEFLAIGRPSMLKIRGISKPEGEASALEGSLAIQKDTVKVTAGFALNTLDTDNKMRNTHMKDKYLETGKFPKAEFVLTELKLPGELQKGDDRVDKVPFKGTLTVHGVPQSVDGTVDIRRNGANASFVFAFGTKITKHQIELPSFMGVTVAEDVQIKVEVEGPLL